MRPILAGSLCLSAVVLCTTIKHPTWLEDSQHWIHELITHEHDFFKPAETESQLAAIVQSNRHEVGQKMLQTDPELHNWLAQRLEKEGGRVNLQTLANEIQDSCPRYLKLSSTALQSATLKGLSDQVAQWHEVQDEDFTHLTAVARTRSAGLGFECVMFAGQRLGDLVPELIGHGRDQFFSVCPLCGHGQTGLVLARKRTVFLECPDCHRTYAVIAVDLHGTFHFVSSYLKSYAPVAHFPKNLTRVQEMLRIWDEVIHTVDYLPDSADGIEDNDAWQFAEETQKLGTGDCEDSSIYLADWLISRGFEVRVAVGHYGEVGGHAWVMCRVDGNVYLLEATNSHANVSHPPLASEVGARYVPEAMFDRESLYVKRFPSQPWNGDYWSPRQWVRVETPGTKTVPALASQVTDSPKAAPPAAAPSPH
jgi:hypothetical protein